MSTSKCILFASYAMALLCLGIFIYCLFAQNPYTNEMGIIVIAAFTEVSIHTAVYSSKSKKENSLKIAYGMVEKWADKYGIENVTNMFEIVNRE